MPAHEGRDPITPEQLRLMHVFAPVARLYDFINDCFEFVQDERIEKSVWTYACMEMLNRLVKARSIHTKLIPAIDKWESRELYFQNWKQLLKSVTFVALAWVMYGVSGELAERDRRIVSRMAEQRALRILNDTGFLLKYREHIAATGICLLYSE